jgi:hypothetical protein
MWEERELKDYKIPGVRPRFYLPIVIFSLVLWVYINPAWNLAPDYMLLFFMVFVFAAISAAANFCNRLWRHWRK